MDEIYGQDIKIDEGMQAVVAANGELLMTSGPETGAQDIKIRLFTPLGSLFYDKTFGAKLHEWINDENSLNRRLGFCSEVGHRVRLDPRVSAGSETCRIIRWDEQGIKAGVSWAFINENREFNLVIEIDSKKTEMVVKDVNPNQ